MGINHVLHIQEIDILNTESHPPLTPFATPFEGGLLSFPTKRVGELNH